MPKYTDEAQTHNQHLRFIAIDARQGRAYAGQVQVHANLTIQCSAS